jgi:hypothetical protein
MLYKTIMKYFALFITLFFSSSAQQISSVYNFPIKPGTEEWKALKTHKEMLEVCQIPENYTVPHISDRLLRCEKVLFSQQGGRQYGQNET